MPDTAADDCFSNYCLYTGEWLSKPLNKYVVFCFVPFCRFRKLKSIIEGQFSFSPSTLTWHDMESARQVPNQKLETNRNIHNNTDVNSFSYILFALKGFINQYSSIR